MDSTTFTASPKYRHGWNRIRIIDLYDDESKNDYDIEAIKKQFDCDSVVFNPKIRKIESRFEILDL